MKWRVDTSKILKSGAVLTEETYEATEDCYASITFAAYENSGGIARINGLTVGGLSAVSAPNTFVIHSRAGYALYKGDVLRITGNQYHAARYTIYGVK